MRNAAPAMLYPTPDATRTTRSPGSIFPRVTSVVEGHRDARGAGVTPLFHHHVRLLHRQPEVLHDELDRRPPHLRQEKHVDVGDGEAAVGGHLAHELRPAFVVELGRIALDELDRRAACLHGLDRRRLVRPAGQDRPVPVVRAVRAETGCDEAGRFGGLEHGGAGAVPEEEDHRVVRGRELVHHVGPDRDDGLQGPVRRDEARRRRETRREGRARAADVERARRSSRRACAVRRPRSRASRSPESRCRGG